MVHIQLKGVSDEVHAELRRRATADGLTIRDYVLRLIERDQERPSRGEWLSRIRQLAPVSGEPANSTDSTDSTEAIRADRDERDRELDARSA